MIVITTQCFAPKIGGIESLMTGMAEALSDLGKEFLVLADGPKQKSDKDQNYKIRRINTWKPIRRMQKARYLKKIIHKELYKELVVRELMVGKILEDMWDMELTSLLQIAFRQPLIMMGLLEVYLTQVPLRD